MTDIPLRDRAKYDVFVERDRQASEEGFSADHDDRTNKNGELAMAATAYAINAATQARMLARGKSAEEIQVMSRAAGVPEFWPWRSSWWKSKGARENLVRAAALLIAEIERLDRAQPSITAKE